MTELLIFSSSFSYFTTGTHQVFARCPNGYHQSPFLYCYWKNNDDKNGSRRTTGIQRLMIRRAERFLSEVIYSSFIMYHAFVYNTHVIWGNILSNKAKTDENKSENKRFVAVWWLGWLCCIITSVVLIEGNLWVLEMDR